MLSCILSELIVAPGGDDICARCADEKGLYVCIECSEAYEDYHDGSSTEDGWVCHNCVPAKCCECGEDVYGEIMCGECVYRDRQATAARKGE